MIFYFTIEKFFEEQTYAHIEKQQNSQVSSMKIVPMKPIEKPISINKQNILITQEELKNKNESINEASKEYTLATKVSETVVFPAESIKLGNDYEDIVKFQEIPKSIEMDIGKEIIEQAKAQTVKNQRYEKTVAAKNMYYVISKEEIGNQSVYVLSYVWDSFKEKQMDILIQISFILLGIILLSLIPALIISKRLTKPLNRLEKDMKRIAKREWDEPIKTDLNDEIGSLSNSCEWMRQQLVSYDNKQQSMLQSVSHELKTPIMVIRSYLQAIKDGYYPKGSLDETVDVIDQEAERLEKKALDLLYITNLEYLSRHGKIEEDVILEEIVEEVYERVKYKRTDVKWFMDIDDVVIQGDSQQLQVVFENIFQNQLRYSKDRIQISIKNCGNKVLCRIFNNGPQIEDNKKDTLFNAFEKGREGENGLGLTIVKQIIDMHNGEVWFENEEEGVAFYIKI